MKAIVRVLFITVIFCLCCCTADKKKQSGQEQKQTPPPSIEVQAYTDYTSATIAQPIVYTLAAKYDPAISIVMPEVGSQIAGLRIVDFGEEGPKEVDNQLEYKKWYTLQADIAGAYIIPSMTVAYTDKDNLKKELQTPQIFIQVMSALTAENGEVSKDIIDIKPLQKLERDLTPYILISAGVLVLLVVIVGTLVYIDRRTKRKQQAAKPAHVIALEEFEQLQKENLIARGGFKDHYFRLSDIFRRYIENRFNVPAVEQTTQELSPEIESLQDMTASVKTTTQAFLKQSDLIKFAKHTPATDEIDHSHQDVLTVIEQTKKEAKDISPKSTTDKKQ